MSKVFRLIVDEDNEPVILEEDEVLEDILIRLESISHQIDNIQFSLMKNNDEDSSLDLDISEIDFQSIKKYGVNLTPYYVIIKIQETPSYFKLPDCRPFLLRYIHNVLDGLVFQQIVTRFIKIYKNRINGLFYFRVLNGFSSIFSIVPSHMDIII